MLSVKSLLTLSVGLVLIYFSGKTLWLLLQVKHWPSTEAVITSVGTHTEEAQLQDQRYIEPDVFYTYEVNGATYNASRVNLDPDQLKKVYQTLEIEHFNERYHTGEAVLVYYNPDIPADAVLIPEASHPVYITFAGGVLLFFFSLLSMVSEPKEEYQD